MPLEARIDALERVAKILAICVVVAMFGFCVALIVDNMRTPKPDCETQRFIEGTYTVIEDRDCSGMDDGDAAAPMDGDDGSEILSP